MKIAFSSRERAAGLMVVAALGLLVIFVVGAAARNRWFAARVRFQTQIERGDGLREGSPILLSGVEVGEVGEVALLDDGRVGVELAILTRHAHRLRVGTRAAVRRMLGIGEKRVHLVPPPGGQGAPLEAGSTIPADEPLELLDLIASVNLRQSVRVMERSLASIELFLGKLDEGERVERLMSAFDRISPTMQELEKLLRELREPLVALVRNPHWPGALKGASAVLNDPATKKTLEGASALLAPARMEGLVARTESVLGKVDALTAPKGPLVGALDNANRLLGDGRSERLLGSLEKLTDERRMGRIVDNTAVVAEQMARIGPEIPALTRDLTATLREAVVVLKALQKTWMLDDQAREVRRQMEGEGGKR